MKLQHNNPVHYCPICCEQFLTIGAIIEHVNNKERNCEMTFDRLKAVGILDDADIKQYTAAS